jgi:glycine reductase
MHPENPAASLYRQKVVIASTTATAVGMHEACVAMTRLLVTLAGGRALGRPGDDGYLPRGIKRNVFREHAAAERAVTMLLAKMAGQAFETEIRVPDVLGVAAAPPVRELGAATLAMVTTGGVVPRGNPDRIESRFASRWGRYSLANRSTASAAEWESIHGGFDNHLLNEDPNRVLPLDVLRELEGCEFGRLFPDVFSTVGNLMVNDRALEFGREIGQALRDAKVDGVIFAVT